MMTDVDEQFRTTGPRHRGDIEEPSVHGVSVLLIEDDATLRSVVSYYLAKAGYQVVTAADGNQALAAIDERPESIGLIILDLMLPGLGGFHVLRDLRSKAEAPIIIVSARGEEQDKIDGLELGADDYIVKPFRLREFLARVRAAIRRHSRLSPDASAVLNRGPLKLELDGRRAFVNGNELSLRPKEFGLLTTLALGQGHVFSRQELLDRVWGEEIVVDPRTVDVHISWVRSKLKRAGTDPSIIATVYGAGYRFTAPANRPQSDWLSTPSFLEFSAGSPAMEAVHDEPNGSVSSRSHTEGVCT